MWVRDLLTGLYEVYKKQNNSKAQKRSVEEARQAVEARLLSSGVLLEFMDRLERFEIMYLDHLADFHKKRLAPVDDDEDYLLPPPPPLQMETPQAPVELDTPPVTVRQRQLQILAGLRARGDN